MDKPIAIAKENRALKVPPTASPRWSLLAALLGFVIITLDALVVSVALPAIRDTLGSGVTGLQWVVDGYTLPFAAFLLLAGTLSDRIGAKRSFGIGLVLFTLSSAACGLVPSLGLLIVARVAKGICAALMTPASLALIGEAFPNPFENARAIGLWAVGGAVASAAGPLVGGGLTIVSWRLIFLVNLPVGAIALLLLTGVANSRCRETPFNWAGQPAAIMALTALTFGLIEMGETGVTDTRVVVSMILACISAIAFLVVESRNTHPMVPLTMFREYTAVAPIAIGFSIRMGCYREYRVAETV